MPRFSLTFAFLLFTALPALCRAEAANLKPFVPDSYPQLLASKSGQPFMLVIWSITCSSCLKDMALLDKMHKAYPKFDIVMLAADDNTAHERIQQILAKNNLTSLENWVFADDNAQKLRYEIDPKWYGELPRTYFFDKSHAREGISGVLSQPDYESRFKRLSQ
jgi:thiol-disulfide isomerase/thioredoxin